MGLDHLPVTLTVPQVARILGVSRNHAYVAVRRGDIPSVRIGKRIVVPTHRVVDLLAHGSTPKESASPGPARTQDSRESNDGQTTSPL